MSAKTHPVLKSMLSMGCSDQRAVAVAFQVYIDLCEVKAYWDVQYGFSSALNMIYLTAKESKTQNKPDIIIPLSASSSVSPEWLSSAQQALCPSESPKVLTLALKDYDSTLVYYQLSEGLEPPDAPEQARVKKLAEEKQKLIQGELRRQRNSIYEAALAQSKDVSLSEPT